MNCDYSPDAMRYGCKVLSRAMSDALWRRGETVKGLSRKIDMPRPRVSQWFNALRKIDAKNLEKIELALDVRFEGVDRCSYSWSHSKPFCRAAGQCVSVVFGPLGKETV